MGNVKIVWSLLQKRKRKKGSLFLGVVQMEQQEEDRVGVLV